MASDLEMVVDGIEFQALGVLPDGPFMVSRSDEGGLVAWVNDLEDAERVMKSHASQLPGQGLLF